MNENETYPVSLTDHVLRTIKGDVQSDPVARQYVYSPAENNILPEERADPIGDEVYSPVKGIVHRYPDRALFKPVNICAVYCRYCFRRDMIGPKAGVLKPAERAAALDYIRNTPEIWEVILTGGDPLILSPRQMGEIVRELESIPHVQVLRLHTRIPVADPARVTQKFCAVFEGLQKPVYMAVHINHAQEITDDVRGALKMLHKSGVNLLSQSVLLRGVNDDVDVLENLFRTLVALNVKPYYLHHPDLASGTSHFRLPIAEGQALMRALQGRVSGLCLPTYMLDIPGGAGKVPLTPCYLEGLKDGGYSVTDYQGGTHVYAPLVEVGEGT